MKAFMDYYRLISPGVYEYLLCLTGNTVIAEKLLQETFVLTNQLMMYLKKAPYLEIWTFSQAKKKYEDYLKSPEKYQALIQSSAEQAGDRQDRDMERRVRSRRNARNQQQEEAPSEKDEALKGVSDDWIRVRQLTVEIEDPLLRQVMALILFGGLDFKDVSMILGKSEMWAKMAYYRGKMQMFGRNAS